MTTDERGAKAIAFEYRLPHRAAGGWDRGCGAVCHRADRSCKLGG
jgi:hypothetical protein